MIWKESYFSIVNKCASVDECAIAHGIALQCIRLTINQPVQKLVGVVAATVETVSLQQKSVSQSSPIAKAKEQSSF